MPPSMSCASAGTRRPARRAADRPPVPASANCRSAAARASCRRDRQVSIENSIPTQRYRSTESLASHIGAVKTARLPGTRAASPDPVAPAAARCDARLPVLLILVLQLIQPVVDAALGQELLVGARLAQRAAVQDEDVVHVLDGRQPVRDGDRRAARHQDVQRVADEELGFGVDARRRFVEDQHARIEGQRAGERQQLLLADRQGCAALGDRRCRSRPAGAR